MRKFHCLLFCLLTSFILTGCGDDITKDPNNMLQTVKNSAIGSAYNSYSYFVKPNWKSIKNQDDSYLVQFEAEYDMPKIITTTCKKEDYGKWTTEEQEALKGMMHVAVFDIKDEQVVPRFSGWGINCGNGETKSFDDEKMNTLQEVQKNGWYTDCATMQQLARLCLQPPAKEKQQ